MEDFKVQDDEDLLFTPIVALEAKSGKCLIEGESYLEDAFDFYSKITNWMQQYLESTKGPIHLDIKLTYFNTSSSRGILTLLTELASYQKRGKEVEVIWYYPIPDEDDMLSELEDFVFESGIKMEIVPLPSE